MENNSNIDGGVLYGLFVIIGGFIFMVLIATGTIKVQESRHKTCVGGYEYYIDYNHTYPSLDENGKQIKCK